MIFGQERTRDSSFWLAFLLGVAQTKKQNALHTVRPVRPSTSASFCPWQRNGSCWRLSAELWVYRGGYRWNAERCRCGACKWLKLKNKSSLYKDIILKEVDEMQLQRSAKQTKLSHWVARVELKDGRILLNHNARISRALSASFRSRISFLIQQLLMG